MVSAGIRWSRFYLVTLGLAAASVASLGWSYRRFEEDGSVQLLTALERTASRQNFPNGEPTKLELLARSIKNRTTLLGALFILSVSAVSPVLGANTSPVSTKVAKLLCLAGLSLT